MLQILRYVCLLGILATLIACSRAPENPPPPDPEALKKELEKLNEERKKEWETTPK